jgi:hypothetical protein
MGVLLLIGFVVVVYAAFGILYFQQGRQQQSLTTQINKLAVLIAKPLPPADDLQAEYDKVNELLAPKSNKEVLEKLVGLAEQSGIDVTGKLRITYPSEVQEKRGETTYKVLSFKNISVQGSYDSVIAFISAVDSGEVLELETMVLKKVNISQVTVKFDGDEGQRRAEFREVVAAVRAMMTDNNLSEMPHAMKFGDGVATNLMGDDPDTEETFEGFPDTTTPVPVKGYSGSGAPRPGYVLYQHDRIDPADTTQFTTINYIRKAVTTYYYTCEINGVVRQFSGPDLATAEEFLGMEETIIETLAVMDVNIYSKP